MLTADRLRDVLEYDPETGVFRWRVSRRGGTATEGALAGSKRVDGYRAIKVDGVKYKEHRLAWLYMTGEWPVHQIDHINLVRDDNRWSNLREADHASNMRNCRERRHGSSGVKGVSWHKRRERWSAQIRVDGKLHYLGLFADINEAAAAYAAASERYHGEFGRVA